MKTEQSLEDIVRRVVREAGLDEMLLEVESFDGPELEVGLGRLFWSNLCHIIYSPDDCPIMYITVHSGLRGRDLHFAQAVVVSALYSALAEYAASYDREKCELSFVEPSSPMPPLCNDTLAWMWKVEHGCAPSTALPRFELYYRPSIAWLSMCKDCGWTCASTCAEIAYPSWDRLGYVQGDVCPHCGHHGVQTNPVKTGVLVSVDGQCHFEDMLSDKSDGAVSWPEFMSHSYGQDLHKNPCQRALAALTASGIMDYEEAAGFLASHPIFNGHFFDRALDVQTVKVNPTTHSIEFDERRNTLPATWLEVSVFDSDEVEERYRYGEDTRLGVSGLSFEEAIVNLAALVRYYYPRF